MKIKKIFNLLIQLVFPQLDMFKVKNIIVEEEKRTVLGTLIKEMEWVYNVLILNDLSFSNF